MVVYEFYSNDGSEEPKLIGVLPERRKDRRRITRRSVMRWGKLLAGDYLDPNKIYYIRVESQKKL